MMDDSEQTTATLAKLAKARQEKTDRKQEVAIAKLAKAKQKAIIGPSVGCLILSICMVSVGAMAST